MVVFYVFIALIILMLLITVHEAGHYLAGKALGFKINEFSIGFGKSIFSKTKKNGEKFSIRIIPLGGYCAFEGEDKPEQAKDSFNAQKPWKRLIVQMSGALFNIFFGIIMCAVLLWVVGYDVPKVHSLEDTPYTHELQVGDVIRKVNGKKVTVWGGNTFNKLMSVYEEGDTISITITRGKNTLNISETLTTNSDGVAVIGITTQAYKHNFFEGIGRSFEVSFGIAGQVLEALWGMLTGAYSIKDISGPVGTIGIMANLASKSFAYILLLIPVISINLGIFNLLPLPALDGGRMVFTFIEMVFRKPVKREIEATIHTVGIFILFALVIFIDLFNLIR